MGRLDGIMTYVPDNLDQFERYDAEREAELEKLPRCADCDHPIQQGYFYYINGEMICPSCIDTYRRDVDDYV